MATDSKRGSDGSSICNDAPDLLSILRLTFSIGEATV